jgi:hypothetical protein
MMHTAIDLILFRPRSTEPVPIRLHQSGSLRFPVLWVAALALFLAGCASIGPGTIGRDRIDYDHAVTASWQRQLLLNLVKLRYGDTPFFLDVASITNSYGLETHGA